MANQLSERIKQPAPRWFRRTKRAISICSNGVIIMLLAMGYADNSLIMLVLKVGISTAMASIEALLVDKENDDTTETTAL